MQVWPFFAFQGCKCQRSLALVASAAGLGLCSGLLCKMCLPYWRRLLAAAARWIPLLHIGPLLLEPLSFWVTPGNDKSSCSETNITKAPRPSKSGLYVPRLRRENLGLEKDDASWLQISCIQGWHLLLFLCRFRVWSSSAEMPKSRP